jgi:hypothetical protein
MSKAVYDALFDGAAPPAPGLEQLALLAQTGQGLRAPSRTRRLRRGATSMNKTLRGSSPWGSTPCAWPPPLMRRGARVCIGWASGPCASGTGSGASSSSSSTRALAPWRSAGPNRRQIRVTLVDEGAVEIVRFPQSEGLTLTAQDGTTHALRRVIP